MECGGIAEGGAGGAHRAAARRDASAGLRRRAVLHQHCAAERGDLAHRLHAVLVRRRCCCRRTGAPVFATALSKRVANWIRTTDTLSEIVNTPKPGDAVGKRIAEARLQARRRAGIRRAAGRASPTRSSAPRRGRVARRRRALFAGVRRDHRRRRARPDRHAPMRWRSRRALDLIDADKAATPARRGPGRKARAARRRRGGLYRGRARSRRRPAHDPRSRDAAAGGPFRRARLDRLQGRWVRRTRSFAKDTAKVETWFDEIVRLDRNPASRSPRSSRRTPRIDRARADPLDGRKLHRQLSAVAVASSRAPGKDAPVNGQFLVLTVELTSMARPWIGAAPLIVGLAD